MWKTITFGAIRNYSNLSPGFLLRNICKGGSPLVVSEKDCPLQERQCPELPHQVKALHWFWFLKCCFPVQLFSYRCTTVVWSVCDGVAAPRVSAVGRCVWTDVFGFLCPSAGEAGRMAWPSAPWFIDTDPTSSTTLSSTRCRVVSPVTRLLCSKPPLPYPSPPSTNTLIHTKLTLLSQCGLVKKIHLLMTFFPPLFNSKPQNVAVLTLEKFVVDSATHLRWFKVIAVMFAVAKQCVVSV